MAHKKLDSVKQYATGTGTGALTLGSAVDAEFRTMQDAGMNNADTMFVRIQHETIKAEWESVKITYSAGAITRTFDTNAKSATGALINFSAGNKIVSCVLRAGDAVVMDNNGDASITRDVAVGRNLAAAGTLDVTGGSTFGGTASFAGVLSKANLVETAGTASSFRFFNGGANDINGIGTSSGAFDLRSAGEYGFWTGVGPTRLGTLSTTGLSIGAATPLAKIFGKVIDGSLSFGAAGTTKGVRIAHSSSGTAIDGVDSTLSGSYEPLTIGGSTVTLAVSGVSKWNVVAAGHYEPTADNTNNVGSASFRAAVIYAGTGTINTSGRDAKMFVGKAIAAEKRAAVTIRTKPRRYKLKVSIDEKGEERARWHFGYIAEDVRDALAAEGLDPWAYAFLCSDPIIKREDYFETVRRPKKRKVLKVEDVVEIIGGRPVMTSKEIERDEPVGELVAVLDANGEPVMRQIEEDENSPATMAPLMHFVPEMEDFKEKRTREVDTGEVRLGLRYSELEAFLRCAD